MSVKVLCAGDIHMGRRSSRVQNIYRSADAWRDIVAKAIELQVDLVALSGDIVDKESKSYEALGPMLHGLARLNEAGIQTVAVAGNHDWDVLPRLADITGTDRFHLLGRGGIWERYTLKKNGITALHIDGWSFNSEHIRQRPLHSYSTLPGDGVPTMGLMHGDMGVVNSNYAPIALQELWALPFDLVLLGHVHMPQTYKDNSGKLALYPGSPYALDPGESGIHGVWLAENDDGGSWSLTQLPISPVQYVFADLNLHGIASEVEFQSRLAEKLQSLGKDTSTESRYSSLKVLSTRLRCVGESSAHRQIANWIELAKADLSDFQVGAVQVELDGITSSVRPHVDLQQRAEGSDPVAEAAKIILAMDQVTPPDPYHTLVYNTLQQMRTIHDNPGYARLKAARMGVDAPSESAARELVRQRAWEVLSVLVDQESIQ